MINDELRKDVDDSEEDLFLNAAETSIISNSRIGSCLKTFNCCGFDDNIYVLVCLFTGTTLFTLAQLAGAMLANSLALYGDCATMALDSLTYLLNIYCEKRKIAGTIEALRLEVMVASISVLSLAFITIVLLYDSLKRLHDSKPGDNTVDADIMLFFSIISLIIDFFGCSIFLTNVKSREISGTVSSAFVSMEISENEKENNQRNSTISISNSNKNINMASAFLHLGADTLRTITVLITALVVDFSKGSIDSIDADAAGSIVVCIIILAVVIALVFELIGLSVSLYNRNSFDSGIRIDIQTEYDSDSSS